MLRKKLSRNLIICAFIAIALCLQFFYGNFNNKFENVSAVSESVSNFSNGNFNTNPNSTYLETSPNGWTPINASGATVGVINVTSSSLETYNISSAENPGRYSDTLDKKILMINSKGSNNLPKNSAFKSSSAISLSSYSYYKLTALIYTQSGATASLYISDFNASGLNTETHVAFESVNTGGAWLPYEIYIETGFENKNIQLELMLGSKSSVSNNAVFFDDITFNKISGDLFSTENSTYVKSHSFNRYLTSVDNANFETGNLTGWTLLEESDNANAFARVMNIVNADTMRSYGLTYLGSDYSYQNTKSLVLYSSEESAIGYKSSDIAIPAHSIMKISVKAKVSSSFTGNATVALKEQNSVIDFYEDQDMSYKADFYTPKTNTITINSNSTNNFQNYYTTLTFYVKGHELFDTKTNLELWLGYRDDSSETLAIGTVVFDDVTIENLTYEEFNSISVNSFEKKVEFTTLETSSPAISNNTFNLSEKATQELTFPVKAKSWTTTYSNEEENVSGIINVNTVMYEANKADYGNLDNPQSKNSSINDTQNIYMMWNRSLSYQSLTSSTFNVASASYYELSFDYRTISNEINQNIMNVYVLNSTNENAYVDTGISSQLWNTYKLLIKTDADQETLKIKIELGDANNKARGYILLDNFDLKTKTMTTDSYAEYLNSNNAIDFSNGKFNLINDTKDSNELYKSLSYSPTLENGSTGNAFAGVIDANSNIYNQPASSANTYPMKRMLVIETINASTMSMVANKSVLLTSGNYYKFSIHLKTNLPIVELEDDATYGVEFSLNGLDNKLTGLISNDEWTKYEIFVKTTQDVSVNPRFALTCESLATKGLAFFDNFSFETIDESIFNSAVTEYENNDIKTMLFIGDTDSETDDEDSSTGGSNFDWLLIPSLIMSLAVVIALTGFILRRIKFKKFERKKLNEYDRNKTLYRDVVRKEAEERRNAELNELKKLKEQLSAELKSIEEDNQEKLKQRRLSGETQISRKTELEFKAYASKHTKLVTKIENIDKTIEDKNTDDYLLAVQRKMVAEKLKNKKLEIKNATKSKK